MFATYNPATVWANDSSIFFDGVNDFARVDIASSVSLEAKNDITLSLWFRMDSFDADFVLWEQTEFSGSNDAKQYLWYDVSERQLKFTRTDFNGNNAATSVHATPKTAVWKHVVVTVIADAGDMIIYVNGSTSGIVTTASSPGDWVASDTKQYYGSSSGTANFYNGHINNTAIWITILTPESVTGVYNEGYPKNELNNQTSKLFLYHVGHEKHFDAAGTTQFSTFSNIEIEDAGIRRLVLSGAIVVSKPNDE